MDSNSSQSAPRRRFLQRLGAWAGVTAAVPAVTRAQTRPTVASVADFLPKYALAQNYKSLKQSSYDRTGGNADRFQVKAGDTQELFNSQGPGVITHIWFTISGAGRDASEGTGAAAVIGMALRNPVSKCRWEISSG